jgi:DNA-binding MarR family transcriptional regulator
MLGDPEHAAFRMEHSPFYLIARTNGRYIIDMELMLKKIGMDIPRWRTLMILRERNASSVSEIADFAVMRLSTVTRLVQRLEKQGLVRLSTRASDARRTDVTLTPKGSRACERVRNTASRVYRLAFADFPAKDVDTLNTLLRRVFRNLELKPR